MSPSLRIAHIASLALVLGCQTSRSAEKQDSFGQRSTQRVDEGPWTRETWEFEPSAAPERGPAGLGAAPLRANSVAPAVPATGRPRVGRDSYGSGGILRHTIEKHDPVVSTTQTQTTASGEAHSASAARFGWSPWSIAIGLAVAAVLAYAAYRLKSKLPF